MRLPGTEEPVSLEPVTSVPVRWAIEAAVREGNTVMALAEWSKALVAHMSGGLTEPLKATIMARFPALEYFRQEGTPHNAPDEGFIDGRFAVSFPRDRNPA